MTTRRRAVHGFGMIVAAGSLVATGLIGAPAQAATGSTVVVDDGPAGRIVTYRAGSGQENDPSVTTGVPSGTEGAVYTIHDDAPITPGEGCSRPDPADPTTARCAIAELGGNHGVILYLGDRVDRIDRLRAYLEDAELPGWVSVLGGPGNDVLTGGDWGQLYGEAGDDVLFGEHAEGGDGDDVMTAPDTAGAHVLRGGPGNDTLQARAGDDIVDGGEGKDLLSGGRGDDHVSGGPGDDRMYGNSGKDRLEGGPGADIISGGPDADVLHGNSGDDRLAGGAGRDLLSGGPGRDVETQ